MTILVEERVDSAEQAVRLWAQPWFIFLVAFGLRLAVVPFLVGDQLDPARDHWNLGWETGRLARSLASGHGFGSPLFGWTGASAWMTPVYPTLLAELFKIFGIYSTTSAYVILSLNCLFAALTCFPLGSIARATFGQPTAVAAAWAWALFPYSIDFAAGRVWSTALSALLLTWAIAGTIVLERKLSPFCWATWGLLWGVIALTDPSLLTCLAVAGVWLVLRLRHRGLPWIFFWRAGLAAFLFLLVVTPWFVRNQRVFGRFIPLRSNFWLVFYQGNTWDTFDLYPDWANPPHNPAEMTAYARMGEVAYMAEKKEQALAEVRQHPSRFAWTTLRRITFTWTGYWNLSAEYRRIEPFAWPNLLMTTTLSVLAGWGLLRAFRCARRFAFLLAFVLLVFPAIYYITHPSMAYRHPIDPLLLVLGVSVFATSRAASREPEAPFASAEARKAPSKNMNKSPIPSR